MDKYEYKDVHEIDNINELGTQGWRVVPGIATSGHDEYNEPCIWLLMERQIEEPFPETAKYRELVECGRTKAGGWGSIGSSCTLEKGHDGPHSWVIQ
jgi:hypothetical protein